MHNPSFDVVSIERPSINPKFSSFQLVPYRPTDDEVVHSKRLGNKVLVDLYRSNPLIVI